MGNKTPSNNEKCRIFYLDVARGFAILFMFAQHCMIVHEKTAGEGSNLLANIFVLLGTAPAAPVFMLIMGIFLMASKASLQKNIIRGIKLIFLGYLLNLLRFTIPLLITGTFGFQYATGETPTSMFLATDILQLAGLSIVVGSLIKNIIDNKIIAPITIAAILLISPFLWHKFGDSYLFSVLCGNGKNVYFPFFPWFIYPLLGMYLSRLLLDMPRKREYLKELLWIGFSIIIVGILTFDIFPVGDYHRSGAAIHLIIIGLVFIWLPICLWVSNKYGDKNEILNIIVFWSENVTAVYFIQWVLFGWSILIFDANNQNAHIAALIGLVVLIATHLLVKIPKIRNAFSWI